MNLQGTRLRVSFNRSREVQIPLSVEDISRKCSANCPQIESVQGDTVSKMSLISEPAFGCGVRLPSNCLFASVQAICRFCFAERHALSSVAFQIGSKLSILGGCAFRACSALTLIGIPSPDSIADGRFELCESLSSVSFELNSQPLVLSATASHLCS
jgi:hypothetical protein